MSSGSGLSNFNRWLAVFGSLVRRLCPRSRPRFAPPTGRQLGACARGGELACTTSYIMCCWPNLAGKQRARCRARFQAKAAASWVRCELELPAGRTALHRITLLSVGDFVRYGASHLRCPKLCVCSCNSRIRFQWPANANRTLSASHQCKPCTVATSKSSEFR